MRLGWVAFGVLVMAPAVARAEDERTPPPVVVVAPPPPEPAPPEEDAPTGEPIVTPPLHSHGLEVLLGGSTFAPSLEQTRFTGSGTIDGKPASFDHKGSEMGLRSPQFYGVELGIAYQRRYLALGLVGGVAFARADQGSELAGVYDPTSLHAYSGAVDLAGAIPLGDFSLRFGPVMGIRVFDAKLTGFDLTTCGGRHGSRYPCPETATSQAAPFLEPRVRIDWTPGGVDGFTIGGFASMNVFERPTLGGGIVVGFHSANQSLVP